MLKACTTDSFPVTKFSHDLCVHPPVCKQPVHRCWIIKLLPGTEIVSPRHELLFLNRLPGAARYDSHQMNTEEKLHYTHRSNRNNNTACAWRGRVSQIKRRQRCAVFSTNGDGFGRDRGEHIREQFRNPDSCPGAAAGSHAPAQTCRATRTGFRFRLAFASARCFIVETRTARAAKEMKTVWPES